MLKRKPIDILISYFYAEKTNLEDFQAIFEKRPFVISDSGGFSAHTLGKEVDIAKYGDWLHRWAAVVDVAANLDIKGDVKQTEKNQRYLEGRGISCVMPVFHGGEDLGILKEMVESYPIVFLGNMTAGLPATHPKTLNFLEKVFSIADGKAGIHGFGLTNSRAVKMFPWWSVDSTTWKIGSRYGMISRYDRKAHVVKSIRLGSRSFADEANEWSYMTGLDWRDYAFRDRLDGMVGRLYHYAKPSLSAFEIFKHVELERRGPVHVDGYDSGLHLCYATQPTMTGNVPTDPGSLAVGRKRRVKTMTYMTDEQLVLTTCQKLGIQYDGPDDTSVTVARVRRIVRTIQQSERAQIEGGALAPYILSAVLEMRRYGEEWDEMLGRGSLTSRWVEDQNKVVERDMGVSVQSHYEHPSHRVFVAMSGGLDSTAVYHMAVEAGRNVLPVYVDVGQTYIRSELEALSSMGVDPVILRLPKAKRTTGNHMIYGRNARIVMAIARYATKLRLWGDIWFGNVMGESHVTGSDKSSRFFNTLQALVHEDGHEIRLVSPLIGLEKTDIVRWYVDNGYESLLSKVRPCVADDGGACGKCHACAKTIFAMEYVGVDWESIFGPPDRDALKGHADFFTLSMEREPSHYAPKQVREIKEAILRLSGKGVLE